MIEFGSIYLVARDFEKSVDFYKKLFDIDVSSQNKTRFAIFNANGLRLCILNGYFDRDNPDMVIEEREYNALYDDCATVADAENSRKIVINLESSNLSQEYDRIKALNIGSNLTSIRYINAGTPYWYFCLLDPDGNVIEITGNYTPQNGQYL